MKHTLTQKLSLLLALVTLGLSANARAYDHTHADYNTLLKTHVKDGLVNYAALKAAPAPLDACLTGFAAVPAAEFKTWTKDQRLAFLINLYNAATLKLIVVHYPVASIRDIKGSGDSPWKRPEISLFGKMITLDALENEVIRPEYKEPRIHFALVCAAISCPPLRSDAYTDATLTTQLDEQATRFLATKSANRLEGRTLYLSSIFDWYAADFTAAAGTVPAYVASFFPAADRPALLKKPTVKFTDYNWALNKS